MLQSVIDAYFALSAARAKLTAREMHVVSYRMPSYGTVSMESQVAEVFWGANQTVTEGVLVDMDRLASISIDKKGDSQQVARFNGVLGSNLSIAEGEVPAEIFTTDTQNPLQGVSAVRALQVANAEGQRVYTVTSDNVAQVLSAINQPEAVKLEVADAANAGMDIVVSNAPITYGGQTTSGYIISDPATGAGAYKIASGVNGGSVWTQVFMAFLYLLIAIFLVVAIFGIFAVLPELFTLAAASAALEGYSYYSLVKLLSNWALGKCSASGTVKLGALDAFQEGIFASIVCF